MFVVNPRPIDVVLNTGTCILDGGKSVLKSNFWRRKLRQYCAGLVNQFFGAGLLIG